MNISYQLKNGAFITLNTKDLLTDDWEAVDRETILSKKEKECIMKALFDDKEENEDKKENE